MYKVSFVNAPKNWALPFKVAESLMIGDLERALALASLLQKISTPEVVFEDIYVEPIKSENYETQKK